jgi:hypothetical protein
VRLLQESSGIRFPWTVKNITRHNPSSIFSGLLHMCKTKNNIAFAYLLYGLIAVSRKISECELGRAME